jgi:hypothetical protein
MAHNLIAKDHFEHLIIFADQQEGRQLWQWVRREPLQTERRASMQLFHAANSRTPPSET